MESKVLAGTDMHTLAKQMGTSEESIGDEDIQLTKE